MITPEQFEAISKQINSLKEQQAVLVETLATLAGAIQDYCAPLSQSMSEAIQKNQNSLRSMLDRTNASFDKLVDVGQASLLTNRATSTLYNLAASGKLPSVKSGGRLRFSVSALEAFNNHPRPVAPGKKALDCLGGLTKDFIESFEIESNNPIKE